MSLSKILEEIKRVQPDATEDVESGPVETLRGRRGRKAQAIEALKRLKREYSNDLLNSAAFILVLGDKKEEFVNLATESFKCFKSDPDSFYLDLVNRIPKELYMGKEGISNIFDILGRHLEDKAMELDIVGYPQLIFKQQYRRTINTKEDFVGLVKEAINEQVGGEMVGIQAAKSLTDEAILKDHGARFTPILLPTTDDKFALTVAAALERITKRVFIVSAGRQSRALKAYGDTFHTKEVNPESVEAILTNISGLLKR